VWKSTQEIWGESATPSPSVSVDAAITYQNAVRTTSSRRATSVESK
jgi:hypothetical protein